MITNGKFPVINTRPQQYVPYDFLKQYEERIIKNHGQTLERLSERGGLDWSEILLIINDKPFEYKGFDHMTTEEKKKSVRREVLNYILEFYNL